MRKPTPSAGLLLSIALLLSACGEHRGAGEVSRSQRPAQEVAANAALMQEQASHFSSSRDDDSTQILFGDLHVHTSFSPDALTIAMPLSGGDGLHPPADACDYARFCSQLDFWSINDHAEGITPARWQATRESIRQCNAVSNKENPDTVAFLGWEWSQVAANPEQHYGHKNVIFLDTADADTPSRAIAAPREQLGKAPINRLVSSIFGLMDWPNRQQYWDYQRYYDELAETPSCADGISSPELPDNCLETAADPQALFRKLQEWGFEHIVIPHGSAWGMNTPPLSSFDKQLAPGQHSPETQLLIESYSGHGNSEEYRDWRAIAVDAQGNKSCPLPSGNYTPCCWRAGEIITERCEQAGENSETCEQRAEDARQAYVDAGVSGHLTVPGQQVQDWQNCGQCEDCFLPPMDHRPTSTAQYALAISRFESHSENNGENGDKNSEPQRFRFGIIGSSDNHRGRGGVGYKEFGRFESTESTGMRTKAGKNAFSDQRDPTPYAIPLSEQKGVGLAKLRNMERQTSFYYSGGLVAAHTQGRDRESIWQALKQRQVYATSGDRIQLWFELLRDGERHPMGSEHRQEQPPVFEVRAAGALEQLPGCPDSSLKALGSSRLDNLCRAECYNPSNTAKPLDRIEVVRIRPQAYPDEPLDELIEDPWRRFDCAGKSHCQAQFSDTNFDRDSLYYVRAIQRPTPAINGGQLRCELDEQGRCIELNPCFGDERTDFNDDCLAPTEERAWSSPIFIDYQQKQETKDQGAQAPALLSQLERK